VKSEEATMSGSLTETPFDLTEAIRNLVTEDDEPVDNILSEKQQRLLVDALYESWTPPAEEEATSAEPRPFWAAANVGIFRSVHLKGIAPDVFISLDVSAPADLRTTEQRSYFMWEHGKPPEVVLEIVSNRKGKELESKRRDYAQMGVIYYVVFDPLRALQRELGDEVLRVYEIGFGKRYRRRNDYQLPEVSLSLTLWEGRFEDSDNQWLRWCDAQGNLLLTGHERAAQEANRASRLAAKLRELGIDPEQV
jgi:Uma2 family endonuclease